MLRAGLDFNGWREWKNSESESRVCELAERGINKYSILRGKVLYMIGMFFRILYILITSEKYRNIYL